MTDTSWAAPLDAAERKQLTALLARNCVVFHRAARVLQRRCDTRSLPLILAWAEVADLYTDVTVRTVRHG